MPQTNRFESLGVMLDCSRNAVLKPETVFRFIDIVSAMGYNSLHLYLEDTYEIEGEPFFGYLRGRYGVSELKAIVAHAKLRGMEVVPCIQTLAHMPSIMRWDHFSSEVQDCYDILLTGEEKTYALIEKMFKTLSQCFPSGKVNIGMDEAHFLGLGKYLDRNGYEPRTQVLLKHLKRVSEISQAYGFRPYIWSDMLSKELPNGDTASKMPQNTGLIYWDYYSTDEKHYDEQISHYKSFGCELWFAGGVWTWSGFSAKNGYAMQTVQAALPACLKHGIKNIVMTMWGDNGAEASAFSALPSLLYAAELAKGNSVDEDSLRNKFAELTGENWDDFLLMERPDTLQNKIVGYERPSKYRLYNDHFFGVADYICSEEDVGYYADLSQRLGAAKASSPEFGYLYECMESLCSLLELKSVTGIRLRKAYQEGDRRELEQIASAVLPEVCARLRRFHQAFKARWYRENKTYGWEIQDMRIGGVILRTESCREDIERYLRGELAVLEGLDSNILLAYPNDENGYPDYTLSCWGAIVSSSVL